MDAILGNLKQILASKAVPACAATSIERSILPARRIEGVQLASGSKPDVPVIGGAIHSVGTRKGAQLTNNFRG